MRSSVAGQQVDVYFGVTRGGACNNDVGISRYGTITTTTTMATYEVPLAGINRANLVTIELDTISLDTSLKFILDDVQLVP
jgi:hypothetical protein